MREPSACLRCYSRILTSHFISRPYKQLSRPPRPRCRTTPAQPRQSIRSASTIQVAAKNDSSEFADKDDGHSIGRQSFDAYTSKSRDHPAQKLPNGAVRRFNEIEQSSQTSPADGLTPRQRTNLYTELKYLKDPLKLANHVRYTLEKDDEEKALALCRLSSKDIANVVSWNHLMDWQMNKGKTNAALSTFNEMKKRAQKPDGHTYTILLRGLAHYAHHPNSLGKALSLYHAIKLKNSGIAATIHHVNAVIKVCARANDMDSMWDIASQLPDRGPHAADQWTFSIILNYLRINILTDTADEPMSDEALQRVEEVVVKGKQLWNVIIARWQEGELLIDETLVCAMGRLLLAGQRPKDWDNVFSLVQQTMNITRLEPRLGSIDRAKSGAPVISALRGRTDNSLLVGIGTSNAFSENTFDSVSKLVPSQPDLNTLKSKRTGAGEVSLDLEQVSEDKVFDDVEVQIPNTPKPTPPGRKLGRGLLGYASPANNTLSLLIEACLKSGLKLAATGYWDLLTNPNGYAITPDVNNVNMILRVHQRSGNSTRALKLLKDIGSQKFQKSGGTFKLAMTTCERNPGQELGLKHAHEIVNIMQRSLPEPHIRTMTIYVNIATSYAMSHNEVDVLTSTLRHVWPSVTNLRTMIRFTEPGKPLEFEAHKLGPNCMLSPQQYREEVLDFFDAILQSLSWAMNTKGSAGKERSLSSTDRTWSERQRSLATFVKGMKGEDSIAHPDSHEPSSRLPPGSRPAPVSQTVPMRTPTRNA